MDVANLSSRLKPTEHKVSTLINEIHERAKKKSEQLQHPTNRYGLFSHFYFEEKDNSLVDSLVKVIDQHKENPQQSSLVAVVQATCTGVFFVQYFSL